MTGFTDSDQEFATILRKQKRMNSKMEQICLLLPKKYVEDLDFLVGTGMYPSRGAAIRMAIRDLLLSEMWR